MPFRACKSVASVLRPREVKAAAVRMPFGPRTTPVSMRIVTARRLEPELALPKMVRYRTESSFPARYTVEPSVAGAPFATLAWRAVTCCSTGARSSVLMRWASAWSVRPVTTGYWAVAVVRMPLVRDENRWVCSVTLNAVGAGAGSPEFLTARTVAGHRGGNNDGAAQGDGAGCRDTVAGRRGLRAVAGGAA